MATITKKDMKVGSVVMVRPDFGSCPARKAVVENFDKKNGRALIDYHWESDPSDGGWAYFDQITSVIKK